MHTKKVCYTSYTDDKGDKMHTLGNAIALTAWTVLGAVLIREAVRRA